MRASELFARCVTVPYTRVGEAADFAAVREGEVLYLFFEDSDGGADWRRNLNFPTKPYRRMGRTVWLAHRGFLKVWREIEPHVAGAIADPSVRKVVTVGYSHGAAVAVLCHEYVWFYRPDLRACIEGYGFGCPRVFWGMRTEERMRRWERFLVVRNMNDIVTHLPPAWLGYSHVGTVVEIGERGRYSPVDAHRAENIWRELRALERSGDFAVSII